MPEIAQKLQNAQKLQIVQEIKQHNNMTQFITEEVKNLRSTIRKRKYWSQQQCLTEYQQKSKNSSVSKKNEWIK